MVWFGLVWFDSVWFRLVRSALVWFGLVPSGSVCSGLIRFGPVWFGLLWFDSLVLQYCLFAVPLYCSPDKINNTLCPDIYDTTIWSSIKDWRKRALGRHSVKDWRKWIEGGHSVTALWKNAPFLVAPSDPSSCCTCPREAERLRRHMGKDHHCAGESIAPGRIDWQEVTHLSGK